MNKMKNQPMHRVWGRIGCLFLLTDLEYKQLTAAMRENNPEAVRDILIKSFSRREGNSYLPFDCEENPNMDYDFEFEC